jgi:hypothetical protein
MEAQPKKSDEFAGNTARARKPYATPVLEAWGTLREVTQKVGANGKSDGGSKKTPRTRA